MSYIPHSSFTNVPVAVPTQIRKKRTFKLFNVIAFLVVLGTLFFTVGVFFYIGYEHNQLNDVKNSLSEKNATSNDKYTNEIYVYQKKLQIAKYLLDTHIAPSLLMKSLEESVNNTVQFQKLEFTYDPGFASKLTVSGVTPEFASLALQRIQFADDSLFSNFVLSKVALVEPAESEIKDQSQRKVGFTIKGTFQKNLFSYTGKIIEDVTPSVESSDQPQATDIVESVPTTSVKTSTP